MVAQAPVAMAPTALAPTTGYYYAPMGAPMGVAAAPAAMAPTSGYYYAPMGAAVAPVALSPGTSYVYPTTANAPQVLPTGTANAPTSFPGNAPPAVIGSRLTDDGRRDVLDDLRTYYQQNKSSQSSRTALRRALKDEARDRYVDVIGGDVSSADDLKNEENKEIDLLVDLVMREDASAPGATSYSYGAQPMFYYYVYPVAPAAKHPHLHHGH
jgi:hypothetical protein